MKSCVVLVSGGMDSTTALAWAVGNWGSEHVHALSVNYGQRHIRELDAAQRILNWYQIPIPHRHVADLTSIKSLLAGSALTSSNIEVPEGHYEAETMKATVVPNRNAIMLNVALACAISKKLDGVVYGAHAGDHAIYPDCRIEFLEAMKDVARRCHETPLEIEAPFIIMGKHEIAALGHRMQVPYELTWSCYKGGEKHCGKCGTCAERKEAFEKAGLIDPTDYEDAAATQVGYNCRHCGAQHRDVPIRNRAAGEDIINYTHHAARKCGEHHDATYPQCPMTQGKFKRELDILLPQSCIGQ